LAYTYWLLFGGRKNTENQIAGNLWNKIGYWRLLVQKNIFIEKKLVRIELLQKQGNSVTVAIDNKVYKAYLNSICLDKIEFEFDTILNTLFYSEDKENNIHMFHNGFNFTISDSLFIKSADIQRKNGISSSIISKADDPIIALLPGRVIKLMVKTGDQIDKGHPLVVIESMKTENHIMASAAGVIQKILVKEGQQVRVNQPLIEMQ
jgi:biotin carboxyl carrier protein